MKKSEIYAKAADVINEKGWYQGNFVDVDTGSVCALGAIRVAMGQRVVLGCADAYYISSEPRVDYVPFGMISPVGISVPTWNDDPSRTKEDVLLYLKEKVYEYEQRGE